MVKNSLKYTKYEANYCSSLRIKKISLRWIIWFCCLHYSPKPSYMTILDDFKEWLTLYIVHPPISFRISQIDYLKPLFLKSEGWSALLNPPTSRKNGRVIKDYLIWDTLGYAWKYSFDTKKWSHLKEGQKLNPLVHMKDPPKKRKILQMLIHYNIFKSLIFKIALSRSAF